MWWENSLWHWEHSAGQTRFINLLHPTLLLSHISLVQKSADFCPHLGLSILWHWAIGGAVVVTSTVVNSAWKRNRFTELIHTDTVTPNIYSRIRIHWISNQRWVNGKNQHSFFLLCKHNITRTIYDIFWSKTYHMMILLVDTGSKMLT